MKEENITETVPTGSGGKETVEGPKVVVLRSPMKQYCFLRDASFDNLEDEYELDTACSLTEKMNLVPVDLPCNTRSARSQSNCTHDVFSRRNMKNSLMVIEIVLAPGMHGHIFCSS